MADELGPIFAAHAAAPVQREVRRSRVRALGPGARRRRLSIATVGTVLAASLAGLSIGRALAHRTGPHAHPAVVQPAGPPIVVAHAAAAPSAPLTTAPAPAPQIVMTEPAHRKPAPSLRRVSAPAHHTAHRHVRVASSAPACSRLDRYERAWCAHRAVLAADDRLRHAYHTAVRAGVSRPVLASYRNRWDRLRSRAGSDPGEVVAGYSAMAADLSRMADRRRRTGLAERRWGWG